jgi:hypothetical protein
MLASCFTLAHLFVSPQVLAVGGGLDFEADESQAPGAMPNVLVADSLDFTYHSCVQVNTNNELRERGYFWISSYQDADSVVDSQINYIDSNGYHIYGVYRYQAQQMGMAQPSITGSRLNYLVSPNNAFIELYLDPEQDTILQGCQANVSNTQDDILLGSSMSIAQGELSETDGLANGDFKIVFDNWVWNPDNLLFYPEGGFLVFNANRTNLNVLLGDDHRPEGSGNLFWLKEFVPVDGGAD